MKIKAVVKRLKVVDKATEAGRRVVHGVGRLKSAGPGQKQDASTTEYASGHVERMMKGVAKNRVRSGGRAVRYTGRTAAKMVRRGYGIYKMKKWERANAMPRDVQALPDGTTHATFHGSVKYISPRASRLRRLGKGGMKVIGRLARPVRRMKGRGEVLMDNSSRSTTEYAIQNVQNEMKNVAKNRVRSGARAARYAGRTAIKVWRARKNGEKTAGVAHNPMKTGKMTLKTMNRTPNLAVKTPGKSATAAQRSARNTARTSRMAAHAIRTMRRGTVGGLKALIQSGSTALKATLAGTKAVVAALAAGGWIAVLIVVVVGLIGWIASSCFGVFFSDSSAGQTIQTAVQEINADYQDKLEEIQTAHRYDVLEMSGSRAVWPEVLAVYAVKTTTDPEYPQEVATMTAEKQRLLERIFWAMNRIDYHTQVRTETEIVETDDGSGTIVEEEVSVTKTYLCITVSHKTAQEMAEEYRFGQEQQEMLKELLAEENTSLWMEVLYGMTSDDGQIVAVALSQLGNVGGEPYWSWYGFTTHVDWCACFVSWCANECGYIDSGVIPKFASCSLGVRWFKERGQWADNNMEPVPGTLIFFDWDDSESGTQDGLPDHVGIVEKVEDGRVYTVEGNSGDTCRQNSYPVGYYEILGYGMPVY